MKASIINPMRKIKISFDGRQNNETWNVDEWKDVGEPHLVVSRHSRELAITFESHRERERFINGIHLCRALFMDGDIKREIYLTSTSKAKEI